MRPLVVVQSIIILISVIAASLGQERKTRDMLVHEDLADVVAGGFWIYNDLPKALAAAKQSGKPLLVVFRCIPCEACAQLDSDIVERDPRVRDLLEQFVCARIVHANGMDLSLFQYDYDQSFAAFFMNADKTIYGRYGTRSHQTQSHEDVSLQGFAAALEAALQLHKQYPQNKAALAGKQSQRKPAYPVPEQYPQLRDKYDSNLNYQGKVVQSCIHCHQIAEQQRQVLRDAGQPIPDQLLFPYPHPKIFGLIMDPQQKAVVQRVVDDSPAARDGFQAGDSVRSLAGQLLLSMADFQWVLHNAPAEGKLQAEVFRRGRTIPMQLTLARGWRRRDTLSWRASSWALRRMTTGGLLLENASPRVAGARAEGRRGDASVSAPEVAGAGAKGSHEDASLALEVRHVGQYGPHALAKREGFQKGDVIVSVAGRTDPMRETDLFALLVNRPIGQLVPFTVLRDGKRLELTLPMQP